ncbi:MAG: hypothetical protein IJ317_03730 [Clostridia bacterium]|nr:hypothetical protein [Clostridia bacterium]
MDISLIDPNFKLSTVTEPDVEWHEITEPAFSLHGVFYDESRDQYYRMPYEIAATVSEGVRHLNGMSSGGRVRFSTNSPYVAVQCIAPAYFPMNHMPLTGSHGLSLYADGVYYSMYAPNTEIVIKAAQAGAKSFAFDGLRRIPQDGSLKTCTLYFPLYGGVRKLLIGLKKGCKLQAAPAYKQEKPVVFYGSSITQGGCASHAGNDYAGFLSQWLNFDYINLGFSGNGKAEPQMNDYLAELDASVYVLDYDYNATNAEYLAKTHYPLYERILKSRPNTPIVFLTNSDGAYYPEEAKKRREIIYATYQKAKEQGDRNVWYVSGEKMFDGKEKWSCAVDTCHPNDLGFFRIAEAVEPALKEALNRVE